MTLYHFKSTKFLQSMMIELLERHYAIHDNYWAYVGDEMCNECHVAAPCPTMKIIMKYSELEEREIG